MAEAEWYAAGFREEIGLATYEPLCPRELATHLCVPVFTLGELGTSKQISAVTKSNDFHALTAPLGGTRKFILHNERNSPFRQNADLMHELAHIILNHPLSAIHNAHGQRNYNSIIEMEAAELGATLLLPKPAAMLILREGISKHDATKMYGISAEMLNFRLNKSGARRHFDNLMRRKQIRA